jgi:transcriptional regulator with XRE-family HTH domain
MTIGDRLRALRREKKLTQREIAKKTGLLRCNVGRLETGRAVPTLATLKKMTRALEIPMFQLFYDVQNPPKPPNLSKRKSGKDNLWGNSGKDALMIAKFCRLFGRMEKDEVGLVLLVAQKMSRRNVSRPFEKMTGSMGQTD